MILGEEADAAVDDTIAWTAHQRLSNPTDHDRIIVAFPRIKVMWSDEWQPSSPKIAAAIAIMRDPDTRHNHVREPKTYPDGYSIPSRIVY